MSLHNNFKIVYKMVIHVKDEETDAVVRELAATRGISLTAAIKEAAMEALEADKLAQKGELPFEDRIRPILDRLDRMPRSDVPADKQYFDGLWED